MLTAFRNPETTDMIPFPLLIILWYGVQILIAPARRLSFSGERSRLRVKCDTLTNGAELPHDSKAEKEIGRCTMEASQQAWET